MKITTISHKTNLDYIYNRDKKSINNIKNKKGFVGMRSIAKSTDTPKDDEVTKMIASVTLTESKRILNVV